MKTWFICSCLMLINTTLFAQKVQLPNGWFLSPAGNSIPLSSDLPLNMALAPDGIHAAITNNGNGRPTIDLINLKQKRIVTSIKVKNAWLGLTFSKNYLYASGGNDDIIIRYQFTGENLINKDTLVLGKPWPKNKISPAGLCIDEQHQRLYVVTKEDNALYICDTKTMKVLKKVSLYAEAYTCILNPVKRELYISAWGGSKIWIYDTQRDVLKDSVSTGSHPTDMAVNAKGKWLYVANANSNSVSVINVTSHQVVETLNAAISPDAPIGSTTNSVALSADGKTLYIANADNNYLAVFDVSDPGNSHSLGFIPVGWYPTCVRVLGKSILVANGKGMSSASNVIGPVTNLSPSDRKYKKSDDKAKTSKSEFKYVGNMFNGTLSVIPVPAPVILTKYTKQVYENTPYSKEREQGTLGEAGNPVPIKVGDVSPIKYVFYVLKENRTYDQVLGDMPQGNGDSSLCLFGKKITPNGHKLAQDYVLLDNFYVDAEVSADGHNWSMAAYATDFVEKNWPSNYAGRGGNYDFDGSRPIANPPKGFIWNYCQRAGVSFRNYGEFMDTGKPTLGLLREDEHYCKPYPGWNLDIQDIYREKVFEHDFDSLVAKQNVPHFNTVYLPNDHTSGLSKGAYSPAAQVADNDLALGRLVEHISHSPIWKESVIFVLEDDAQDGPDHVDAHRSVAWVISPFVKRHSVNHTMYSTSGMLRTIELILRLPPMSQYDAAATPMWNCFQATPDIAGYTAEAATININERNTAWNNEAKQSALFNFAKADAAPDRLLNEVVWKAIKGPQSKMPEPRRSAFVKISPVKDDDD
ncbi:bifunctional YncE family protein/alkaline phosphatase family protein [Mucilaginibacter sabulilitoris]|uniref:Bifunctional YncE family protein/alkaline phosphatase family protein n=1 Tax=Mucilaginibacter sabulilitoris TaxID=1173583 RepID=A0ABZ0TX57_9SPHI|nr:bifunctional YncE family protein/alkaline phosphatase family protein [Mucilaginibacter sabulilitoris]WPU97102.1 bifunctional YncE family protein/alkaline phosphatase family protein [Mucilaginibacter sabulilitoris]